MDRVDSLLQELSSRHRNHDPRFLAAVRPLVVSILDGGTPEPCRINLLEQLAETFERDVQVRTDCARSLAGLAGWLAALQKRLQM